MGIGEIRHGAEKRPTSYRHDANVNKTNTQVPPLPY